MEQTSGKIGMPRTVCSDFYIAGASLFYSGVKRSSKDDEEKTPADVTFNYDRGMTTDGNSTPAQENEVDRPQLRLPLLPTSKELSKEEENDLKALLRVRRFDLPLQNRGLVPEWNEPSEKTSSQCSSFQDFENLGEQDGKESHGRGRVHSRKDNDFILPLFPFSTVLKGQIVNLRGKQRSNDQRKRDKTTSAKSFSNQTDSKSQQSSAGLENTKTSKKKLKHPMRGNMISIKHGKSQERPVFHLPKADKYDISPDGTHTGGKVCRVFRLNDLKTSLIYSGHKDSWVPSRDKYLTKYSVFEAILQQPTFYLRQPSPVAGVKMTLQEQHEDSLAAAIQAVEEINVPSPLPDVELTPRVKTFVIKLPPIC